MSWFLLIFALSFTFGYAPSEASHDKKLSSAVVVGTVYCDTCFQQDFSKSSHFISGALVAVECRDGSAEPTFRQEVKTNEHGEFRVNLPFSVSKHVKKIKNCSVKLISSSEPYCAVASTATSSALHLKSRKPGSHIFSAGFFTFKPLKQPILCNQKPSISNSKQFNSMKTLLPPPEFPVFPNPTTPWPTSPIPYHNPVPLLPMLPPLPQLPPLPPLPSLPQLPPIPGNLIPVPAKSQGSTSLGEQKDALLDFFLPTPPLLPSTPPSIGIPLPPNPFQPPSLLPPLPFQPPPSPIINIPPLPNLPPLVSSPPPPPAFPIPIPPFPFQPTPGFPGIPPASSSSQETSP
ncbi:hypothetical protein RJ641_023002 [Dillenia turbinata]|uniref:Uncharacterized protein n=1 Tax=Dillenia turbinata TaxID=194707 RepID=A0AAN8UKD3_9MAGN